MGNTKLSSTKMSEESRDALDRVLNRIMAVIMPLIELGCIGFATYAIVYLVCIQYLLNPSKDWQEKGRENGFKPRHATGVALLVVYFILLVPMLLTFMRLLQVNWTDPGFVPVGDQQSEKNAVSTKAFDRLDAYVCDYNGMPLWCDECCAFKPDRAHHSSQLRRCVRRMDHFCPYAGGMISETSHKFFIQFLFLAATYTGYVMIVMAVFLAERKRKLHTHPSTWIAALVLAAFFFLFTFGMFATSFANVVNNLTTIEVLRKGNTTNIAMRGTMPANLSQDRGVLCQVERPHGRSFVVVQTHPFENPWDMGAMANIKSVMGDSILDWFNPLRMSPCTEHHSEMGEFEWGRDVQRIMSDFGIGSAYSRRRRRSSHKSRGSRSSRGSRGSKSEPSTAQSTPPKSIPAESLTP